MPKQFEAVNFIYYLPKVEHAGQEMNYTSERFAPVVSLQFADQCTPACFRFFDQH